ncbi:MAG: hypothetical protein Q8O86_04605 [Dehalococcoidia bacterium]|nr:hypothetical protein [Dehalococcoidia bacterium]
MMDREEQFRRNHELFRIFMREVLSNPKMRQGIPQEADVIFLPEHDPELKAANLELADALSAEGKKVTFVKVSLVAETMTVFVPRLELLESA